MSLMSGFYVVTSYFGALLVRLGCWVAGIQRVEAESSPIGNFSPVYGDELMRSIVHGLSDAGADTLAAPLVRDAILRRHTVVNRNEMPSVHTDNGFACGGGASRHLHTSPVVVRAQGVALLSIAEFMDAL